jgi:hypothetical protein
MRHVQLAHGPGVGKAPNGLIWGVGFFMGSDGVWDKKFWGGKILAIG